MNQINGTAPFKIMRPDTFGRQMILAGLGLLVGISVGAFGQVGQLVPFVVVVGIALIYSLFRKPEMGLQIGLILSFFISGLTRYLGLPWGLGIDIFLVLALLALFYKEFKNLKTEGLQHDIFFLFALWMGFVILQIGNPESVSITAWFYAMRGIGFYQLLIVGLVFYLYRRPQHLTRFLDLIIALSILGSVWGIKQKYIGLDSAEDHWLWALGHHDEHILHGVLRVFSFYSDAGQFGASQAMVSLMCAVLVLNPEASKKRRLYYLLGFLLTAFGFAISGTRGALAVPACGGLAFLFTSKNFKILIIGLVIMVSTLGLLKYTHVGHGIEQVRRMRTALAADNPSLQARLRNQRTLARHLSSRPLGGGIGSAGYWGERFSPHTIFARTPTDSYYVKIWVETGIIGVCLQAIIFGYIVGRGALVVINTHRTTLRYQGMALFSAIVGVLFASYGNQVFSQMPTGFIMSMCIGFLFLIPAYDKSPQQVEAC